MSLILKTMVPEELKEIIKISEEVIDKITVISVNGSPKELTAEKQSKTSVTVHDALALIISIRNKNTYDARLVYVIAENVMIVVNDEGTLISINGLLQIIPDEVFLEFYKKDVEVRSMTTEKVEDFLEINKSQSVAKIFADIGEYFTAENYQINNNIFRLVRHRSQSIELVKKVLVKSLVAWQLKQ
ncbi:hypothetical protein CJJ23_01335 [Mycoplasmopsis agassizii]|uniref:Uncharacterized protein n=1 Tax=Mycoplasmopsis agassizii TaxID=33922 RepID=A0A269TKI6_9BACT|nr:hypothetical protein [Mycoplasmopsis agassizii]PAK21576.1 hypothetical protein CJJ23_01335 [Mycoplasmopsis agassizii]